MRKLWEQKPRTFSIISFPTHDPGHQKCFRIVMQNIFRDFCCFAFVFQGYLFPKTEYDCNILCFLVYKKMQQQFYRVVLINFYSLIYFEFPAFLNWTSSQRVYKHWLIKYRVQILWHFMQSIVVLFYVTLSRRFETKWVWGVGVDAVWKVRGDALVRMPIGE